jgi:hypothetical protein
MPLTTEFNTTAPGVTATRIKSDFEAIWRQNIVAVTIVRKNDAQAGDYYHEGDDQGSVTRTVYLNIQGESTDKFSREKAGLSTTGATYKAYARWNEDLQNLDVILYQDKKYLLQNLNKSVHNGVVCFQSFDMVRVDANA